MLKNDLCLLVGLALFSCARIRHPDTAPQGAETVVTLLHFSDYHSHAVPFFSEHQRAQAGIARALAYLRREKAAGGHVLVFSGGDMMNGGVPAWSDRYTCAEWGWLSGIVDVMALGNHDVDYGWDAFSACRAAVPYPILSGNLVDPDGRPLLSAGEKPYVVKTKGAVRIGIFALSGPDFGTLVKASHLPPGAHFADPVAAAAQIVKTLREVEKVSAVVFIGHQDWESDFAMARAVPGIDLILGTHSHYQREFMKIAGTATWFISPYQYLTYLSRVELRFQDGTLRGIAGRLVKLDQGLAADPSTAARVADLQAQLEQDPKYKDRFQVIGQAAVEISNDHIDTGESVLGNFAMDILRGAAHASVAISTASSFRAAIPPGPIRTEDFLNAIPYGNQILTFRLTGAQLARLLSYSLSKRATDNFAVTSGLRYVIRGDQATQVQVARGGGEMEVYEPIHPAGLYSVMTTDYIANVAAGYKEVFREAARGTDTGLWVNDTILQFIRKKSPVSARIEGRITEKNP